jgi:hypothetical protein
MSSQNAEYQSKAVQIGVLSFLEGMVQTTVKNQVK